MLKFVYFTKNAKNIDLNFEEIRLFPYSLSHPESNS